MAAHRGESGACGVCPRPAGVRGRRRPDRDSPAARFRAGFPRSRSPPAMIGGLWSHPISVMSSDPSRRSDLEIERLFIVLAVAFLITVLVRTAWLADDAGIELRVVENFVAGNGLRWNVAER